MTISASDIYELYPDSALLGCGDPGGLSDEEYATLADRRAGDTLFVFLLRELCGETELEGLRMLLAAIDDLNAVARGLLRQLRDTQEISEEVAEDE